MFVSCDGIRVNSGEIVMPRVGAWLADLALDGAPPTGACTISVADGAVTFRGTVVRSQSFRERHTALIVGGAGGLSNYIAHHHHRAVPLELPVAAILKDAGETLSTASDAATLRKRLDAWSRRAGTAGDALTTLLDDVGASWRVLDDGTVWVGAETWPEATVAVQTLSDGGSQDSAEVATDLPVLRPGVTVGGRKVSTVIHRFEPSRVRTRLLCERNGLDRLRGAFAGLARQALAAVDYHPSYAATVVQQQGNGDLEVRVADERFRRTAGGTGIAGVKNWPGVPGVSYVLRKGTRVLLGFLDGIGKTPIVTGWHASETPERVTLEADRINLGTNAARGVARHSDTVNAGTLTAVAVPPNGVTITYTPPSGPPVVIALVGTGLTVTPASGDVSGVISSASSKSYAE
ncbi:hypothetical protein [Sorangium sp. So ce1024]|uniref:hypothetical protein n=1 Tax=Sorangium sp. So ce1024 TaxID=3133327 RepID=UPI003F0C65A1